MAIVKLTDTWILENYAQVFESAKIGEKKLSPPLAALSHFAYPGLTWRIGLYPGGSSRAKPNFASVCVWAYFGSDKGSVSSVWSSWTLTVVSGDAKDDLQQSVGRKEYLLGSVTGWGSSNGFHQEALKAAVRKEDGQLEMKLDLTIYKIVDLLKCRETVRALLLDNLHADFTVNVEGKTFQAHKAIFAKRCPGFQEEAVPDGTSADAYSAFLAAIYCDQFDFLTNWELAVGVLPLSEIFKPEYLRQYCDAALAGMIPSRSLSDLLHILPVAISSSVALTKSAIVCRLAEIKDLTTSPEWTAFKLAASKEVLADILEAVLGKLANGDSVANSPVYHAAEITRSHTWTIASANLLQAVAPRPTYVTSPALLENKAFPGVKWQLEFHPHGNPQDSNYTQGFASLYLNADFRACDAELKAVYANWKVTITTKDGTEVSTPVSPDYTFYTGAKEMKFGYANAFPLEPYNDALISKTNDPTESSLGIRVDLTIANVSEILKCHTLISSLHSDKTYADVEIDVSGVIFKAHKCILAVRSSLLSMQEATSGKVEVKDTKPEAFSAFLDAVYYLDWGFLSDMNATIKVLALAEKYGVADLKQYCDEALAHFANAGNVLTIIAARCAAQRRSDKVGLH